MNLLIIYFGKLFAFLSSFLNLGNGSTWPGHIALNLNKNFIEDAFNKSKTKTILITGTNGKTTTSKLLETILENNNKTLFINSSGANLLNGIASAIIKNSNPVGQMNKDFAILEIDENALPLLLNSISPDYIIALNLFRDQLDRYGELDTIAKNWQASYKKLKDTTLILNADDSQIAYLGQKTKLKTLYFGLEEKEKTENLLQHASDSILCPKCGNKLTFDSIVFSHLGNWKCLNCRLKRPTLDLSKFSYYPLSGTYSKYDTLAAVLLGKTIGIEDTDIVSSLKKFSPAFGRQEEMLFENKKVQLFLSKNPTSFNESLKTIESKGARNLLVVLNDKIPDGTDVSWIWDVDFEDLINKNVKLVLSGDRVYDLALRIKHAGIAREKYEAFENLEDAIYSGIKATKTMNTFYILATYSAMLESRKIITGRKIL